MHPPLVPPTFKHWTMSDGYVLRGRLWPPGRQSLSPAIIYVHGIQSHGAWFEWSASLLAHHGRAVILPDRRGSGLNDADRGDTPSWQRWLLDIDELATWARSEFGAERFDLLGVSWGGKPALAWTLRHPERAGRLLLVAPGLFPAVDISTRTRFQIARALLRGGPAQAHPRHGAFPVAFAPTRPGSAPNGRRRAARGNNPASRRARSHHSQRTDRGVAAARRR
jgi:pimeloyl-ACP methyl ester carboxylesterase